MRTLPQYFLLSGQSKLSTKIIESSLLTFKNWTVIYFRLPKFSMSFMKNLSTKDKAIIAISLGKSKNVVFHAQIYSLKREARYTHAASHGERTRGLVVPRRRRAVVLSESQRQRRWRQNKRHSETPSSHLRECYEASTEFTMVVAKWHVRRTSGAPKALAVALSFCRLLGLGCPKQAFAKIATPRQGR